LFPHMFAPVIPQGFLTVVKNKKGVPLGAPRFTLSPLGPQYYRPLFAMYKTFTGKTSLPFR